MPLTDDKESRSLTIYSALLRLKLLIDKDSISLLIAGADRNEGTSAAQTALVFSELGRLLSASHNIHTLTLVLVGPNLTHGLDRTTHTSSSSSSSDGDRTTTMNIHYFRCLCHEIDLKDRVKTDATFAFNSGFYGYDSWLQTLELMRFTPFVVTSYCSEESEDDFEFCMQSDGDSCGVKKEQSLLAWGPEENPNRARNCRSLAKETTEFDHFENNFWFCVYSGEKDVASL